MRVLWFEVTEPSGYRQTGEVIGGWQDSLEFLIRERSDVELFIAFASKDSSEKRINNGVTYIPLSYKVPFEKRLFSLFSCQPETKLLIPQALNLIEEIRPSIIHIFGLEWCWGLVAPKCDVPVVIHIMGSMVPYYNALLPPNYSAGAVVKTLFPKVMETLFFLADRAYQKSRKDQETIVWEGVKYYMGRTKWDYGLSRLLAPMSKYFHVDEALRPQFLKSQDSIKFFPEKIRIISTGCSSFWKGPEMLLKTAHLLKVYGLDFEWLVVGGIKGYIKTVVEKREGLHYKDCNVSILGFKSPDELLELLKTSSLYVHTAYIENSPNSICEAQCVGLPVISTNVGGISTLVSHDVDGILVPANDPWQMAFAIVSLLSDAKKMKAFSFNAKEKAVKRHAPEHILNDLINCYRHIIEAEKQ